MQAQIITNLSNNPKQDRQFKSIIDIAKIIDLSNQGLNNISIVEDKCALMILGSIGSGKSSFSNFMNGRKMIIQQIEIEVQSSGKKSRPILGEKIEVDDVVDFEIGHEKQSQTNQIKALQLRTCEYVICDFPGFFDNRSIEQEIVNTILFKRFLTYCQSVIPIILINYEDFESERGESFKKLYKIISNIFKNTCKEDFNNCLFLYTHPPSCKQLNSIINNINKERDFLKNNKKEPCYYELLETLLEQLEEDGESLILDPEQYVEQKYSQYIKLIQKKNPFKTPVQKFYDSLSLKAENIIYSFSMDLQRQIVDWLIEQQYQSIFNLLFDFKQFSELLKDVESLQQNYQDIISLLTENIKVTVKNVINEFSESTKAGCSLRKDIFEQTKIIDILEIFDKEILHYQKNFENCKESFILQILSICEIISQNCCETDDFQQLICNLQNLHIIQQQLPQAKEIYNQCKKVILDQFQTKYNLCKDRIEQIFEKKQNKIDKTEVDNMIQSMFDMQKEILDCQNTLSPYYEEQLNIKEFHDQLLNQITKKIQKSFYDLKNMITQMKERNNQNQDDKNSSQQGQDLPYFEFMMIKQLHINCSFDQIIKRINIHVYYEDAVDITKYSVGEILKQVKSILDANSQLQQIEHLMILIDQIRSIDEKIYQQTTSDYLNILEQINIKVYQNRDLAESILSVYQSEIEQLEYLIEDNQVLPNTNQNQRIDFIRLSQVLLFFQSIIWYDNYFNKNTISSLINKIEGDIQLYMNSIVSKCIEFANNNQFFNLKQYLSKVEVLKQLSSNIQDYYQQKDQTHKTIIKVICDKIQKIESSFKRKSIIRFEESFWINLNEDLIFLKQINDIQNILLDQNIKQSHNNLITNICSFLQDYYHSNYQFIIENDKLSLIQSLVQQNNLNLQKIFYQNIEFITNKCPALSIELGQNNNLISVQDSIISVYESIFEEYQENFLNRQVNLQQQKREYAVLRAYKDSFKGLNVFQNSFQSFNKITNPDLTIIEIFQQILKQISNQEFNNMIESIKPLISLDDKQFLNKILENLDQKKKYYIDQTAYEIMYFQQLIDDQINDTIKNHLQKYSEIKQIYDEHFKDRTCNNNWEQQLVNNITQFIKDQSNLIHFKAEQQQFQEMEKGYYSLCKFTSVLEEKKVGFFTNIILELYNKLQNTIKNVLKNSSIISNPEKIDKLIKSLRDSISKNNNQTFQQVYSEIQEGICSEVNKYSNDVIINLNKLMQDQEFNEVKIGLNELKQYLESLKQKGIKYENSFHTSIFDLEEQLDQVNRKQIRKIEDILENGDNEKIIDIFYQKENDKELYEQSIQFIKKQFQSLITITSNQFTNLSQSEFESNLFKIQNISTIVAFDFHLQYFYDQQYKDFINQIIFNSNVYLKQANNIVESSPQIATDLNLAHLFKYKTYLNLVIKQFGEDIKIQEVITLADQIENSLLKCLKNLKEEQEEFFTNGGSSFSNHKALQGKCNNFESIIQLVKSDSRNKQNVNPEVFEIGKQLKTFENILENIQNEFQDIEQQILKAWEEADFLKIKNLIDQLNQKRMANSSINQQIKDMSQIFQTLDQNIDKLTKQAQTIIKTHKKYDSNLNTLVSKIYNAEKILSQSNCLLYQDQSQISLVEQELFKKLEDIKQKYSSIKEDNITQTSKILLKSERISESVLIFNPIITKHNNQTLYNFHKESGDSGIYRLEQVLIETSTGRRIVEKYWYFKEYKYQLFRQGMMYFNEYNVLDHFRQSKMNEKPLHLTSRQKEYLSKNLDIYFAIYEETIQKNFLNDKESWEIIPKKVNEIITDHQISYQNWNDNSKKSITKILALICSYWSLLGGVFRFENTKQKDELKIFQRPTITQIISIMMLLNLDNEVGTTKKIIDNKLIEILPKEGKSFVLAICSMILTIIGYKVDILCLNKYLSQRNSQNFKQLFTTFGVQDKIIYCTFQDLSEIFLNQFGDIKQLIVDDISKVKIARKQFEDVFQNKILLTDGVDALLDLKYYGKTVTPIAHFCNQEIIQIIRAIWESREKSSDQIISEIKSSIVFKKLVQNILDYQDYFDRQINKLCQCVKLIEQHKNEQLYQIENDQVIYQNDNISNHDHSYHTLFAYYYHNQISKTISDESLQKQIGFKIKCGKLSYHQMLLSYKYILGTTCSLQSLDSQSKVALNDLNINQEIYTPSMYGITNLENQKKIEVQIVCNSDLWIDKINKLLQNTMNNNQSIIIFFKSKNDLNNFKENNKQLNGYSQEIIELSENMSEYDIDLSIKKSTNSAQITLCQKEFGSGSDIRCFNPDIIKNGGVVLVQTYLSLDATEEIQIFTRIKNQGEQQNQYLILNENDLKNDFDIREQKIKSWKPQDIKLNLYQIRKEKLSQQYKQRREEMMSQIENHNLTISYYKQLQKGQKGKLINILN